MFIYKKLIWCIYLLLILSMSLIISCDDTVTANDIDKRIIPDSDVSFSDHLVPVFNLKCATAGCHDDITRAGSYSMTTWSNVVQAGIVNPFTPETSRLIWRIQGNGVDIMPPLGSTVRPLTENQVDGIITWIDEGAKNN